MSNSTGDLHPLLNRTFIHLFDHYSRTKKFLLCQSSFILLSTFGESLSQDSLSPSVLHQLNHTYSQPQQCFKELHQTCETVLTLSWCIKLSMNALVFFPIVFTRKLAGMNASQTCPVLSHRLSGSFFKTWYHLWHPQLHCYCEHGSLTCL